MKTKIYIFFLITFILISCSTVSRKYYGYENKNELEKYSEIKNDYIQEKDEVVDNNNQSIDVYKYYVLPPSYYPWYYPPYYFRFGYRYPFYLDYYDYYWYNYYSYWYPYYPYNPHFHYIPPIYSGDTQPKRKDYRDFGVSRGNFGETPRNVTNVSPSRNSLNNNNTSGSIKLINSNDNNTNSSRREQEKLNTPDTKGNSNETITKPSNHRNNEGRDINIRQSTPRNENNRNSESRTPRNNSSERNNSENNEQRKR